MNQTCYDIDRATLAWKKVPEALNKMGFTELRGAQKPCIDAILGGQDVFCVLPTGGGKTALAAIPTLVFEYKTVVFSPLIALMKDQIDSLNKKGIRAGAINSNLSDAENSRTLQDWVRGDIQVLYVAPERISHPQFDTIMQQLPPDFVVLDEAHTLSQWAASFRPAYVACGAFIEKARPKQVVALTATATPEIIEDVKRTLGTPNMVLERHYTARMNLHLSSEILSEDNDLLPKILKKIRSIKGSCIVYCSTVNTLTEVVQYLDQAGESVTYYHGQMTNQTQKDQNQDTFMHHRARIMVATNAFGMGIDKADIEGIIHANPPGSVEAIAQEIGRAARDGRDAICHMFATPRGLHMQEVFWNLSNPEPDTIRKTFGFIKAKADKDNILQMTGKEIEEAIGDEGASAALNYLVSLGCIERFKPEAKIATVTFPDRDLNLTPAKQLVYDSVKKYGMRVATSSAGSPVYQVALESLTTALKKTEATITSTLRQLGKDGIIIYDPPFKGKLTRIIKDLTQQDLDVAKYRRETEWQKVAAARNYLTCPDSDKQNFIVSYFAV